MRFRPFIAVALWMAVAGGSACAPVVVSDPCEEFGVCRATVVQSGSTLV